MNNLQSSKIVGFERNRQNIQKWFSGEKQICKDIKIFENVSCTAFQRGRNNLFTNTQSSMFSTLLQIFSDTVRSPHHIHWQIPSEPDWNFVVLESGMPVQWIANVCSDIWYGSYYGDTNFGLHNIHLSFPITYAWCIEKMLTFSLFEMIIHFFQCL